MNEDKSYSRTMTPVRVIEDDNGVKVVFLESARFYQLANAIPEFDTFVGTLVSAVEKHSTVNVITESIESDIIKNIMPAR